MFLETECSYFCCRRPRWYQWIPWCRRVSWRSNCDLDTNIQTHHTRPASTQPSLSSLTAFQHRNSQCHWVPRSLHHACSKSMYSTSRVVLPCCSSRHKRYFTCGHRWRFSQHSPFYCANDKTTLMICNSSKDNEVLEMTAVGGHKPSTSQREGSQVTQ